MLPDNVLSTTLVKAQFTYPYNLVRSSLLEDFELGGIALQDPSQGHQVQAWQGKAESLTGNVYLNAIPDGAPTLIYNQPNPFEFSFAFDQSMRWVAVVTDNAGTTRLRWYDSTIPGYTTTVYTDMNSVRLTLDDSRDIQIKANTTDIIFTYIKTSTNQLCFRAQRDRYLIEYVLSSDLADNLVISNFGMSKVNRLQWRLRQRIFSERLPWLP